MVSSGSRLNSYSLAAIKICVFAEMLFWKIDARKTVLPFGEVLSIILLLIFNRCHLIFISFDTCDIAAPS